ncbi:MAG TPA: hypothetical protein VE646_14335, partial [Actinomycetota bacterium]|nr:hypothetical protein [Actinomycetota bacterium]
VFEAGGPDELYVAGEPVPFMSQVRDTGRAVIYRLDHTGRVVDTLLTYPGSSWTPIQLPNGRTSFAKPRFSAEPRLDARPGIAAASYIPTYVIDVRSPDGRPTLRIARQYENAPVVKAVRDSVLDRLASGPNRIPREALASIPFESQIPAIEGLTMDDRRRVWIDPYAPDQPARRDLFDTEGRFQGPAYLPEPIRLKDIRGGRACGAVHDPDDRSVQVVCYRVMEPPPKA